MVGAAALAITASIACGETLPDVGSDDPGDAGAETSGPESEAAPDSGPDVTGDGPSDAAPEAGKPCTPDLPYTDPIALENFDGLGEVSSIRPHVGGGPFAFVARDLGSGGFFDIVEADYPLPAGGNPVGLRTAPNDEDHPAPLTGNMKVYYDEPIDGGALRIFSATREQPGQKLANPTPEEIPISGATDVMHPWSVAGQEILYVAARNGASTVNIWRIVKSGATWTTDSQLTGPFEKTHPVVSDDETVMFFARNETGKRKVFFVTRPSTQLGWSGALEVQGKVNEPGFDDEPTWISPDKCTLLFTSNRAGSRRAYKIVYQHL